MTVLARSFVDAPQVRPGQADPAPAFLERAHTIARFIARQARWRGDGDAVWFTPLPADGRRPVPLSGHLFSGATGIAFFLAALDHADGTTEHRDLVLACTAPLRRRIAGLAVDPEHMALPIPVGGMVGVGSYVYALTWMGTWMREPLLIESARQALSLLTPVRIGADDHLDVVRGCAGAMLALLVLDELAPAAGRDGQTPLDLAQRCAERLLEQRVSLAGEPRGWPVARQQPRTGFAHGASGIACALLRCYRRTGDRRLRDAALEGFAFERHLYDPVARNWCDPRYGRPLQLQAWCVGAPGVALARLAAIGPDTEPELIDDLGVALDLAAGLDDPPLDHLCCGNLGRADILLSAAAGLGDPRLLEAAHGIAARAIARASTDDGFGVTPHGAEPALKLSLFRGIAGIGYVLLRLASAEPLPSTLALE